ncbi:MAG: hypothetical protein FWD31_04830 [Planctomycetaceae bacterium]|nr:hypothetical protein [Planctomycetaceae bacterium]
MNSLTREEFQDALKKGLGRAVRHVKNSPPELVREDLLDTCTHCKAYDTQCEGFRADWLFGMIELTGEQDYYREKILEAVPENRDADSYDFWQLYHLAKEFAIRGDSECRTVLYREFDLMVDDNNIGGADALVELDGIPGLLHVLDIAGRRIRNSGDLWWEVSYHIEECEEKFGKYTVQDAIEAEASRNEFVQTYCEQKEQVSSRDDFGISVVDARMADVLSQTPPPNDDDPAMRPVNEWIADILADDFDDESIRNATEDNIVVVLLPRHPPLFSPNRRSLTDDEIEFIWSALMSEENPYRLFCLLTAFTPSRRIRLPRFDPKMLSWIDSPYPLSRKAAQTLAHFSDESIRMKALELLQTIPAIRNWYVGIELIRGSFQPEDEEAITTALQTHHFPHEFCLHGVGSDIIKLAETYPEVAFQESLLWFYERTPCSLCRHNVVEELNKRQLVPKDIWEECIDDCDDRLRELAEKQLSLPELLSPPRSTKP